MPGRPKMNRKKDKEEPKKKGKLSRAGGSKKCTNCGTKGHNKTGCRITTNDTNNIGHPQEPVHTSHSEVPPTAWRSRPIAEIKHIILTNPVPPARMLPNVQTEAAPTNQTSCQPECSRAAEYREFVARDIPVSYVATTSQSIPSVQQSVPANPISPSIVDVQQTDKVEQRRKIKKNNTNRNISKKVPIKALQNKRPRIISQPLEQPYKRNKYNAGEYGKGVMYNDKTHTFVQNPGHRMEKVTSTGLTKVKPIPKQVDARSYDIGFKPKGLEWKGKKAMSSTQLQAEAKKKAETTIAAAKCLMRNKPDCFSRILDWLAERKCSEFQMELMSLSKVYASTQSYPRRECRSLRKKYDESSGLPDVRNASVAKMSDLKCHGKN
ncbi:hypothetical protein Tsubulata_019500 [Turnera subulata]|uniref:Uncharacterized protein n=1 Tax=Turnera subulata TaxID=218843 RepID=A0A9Q0FWT9_9ROSI|nr:hypothetical protein Tsubulata_019500 [Turnera subulata]